MNIIEAVKSGKPFRRKIDSYSINCTQTDTKRWIYITRDFKEFRYVDDKHPFDVVKITGHDIIASDWIVKNE